MPICSVTRAGVFCRWSFSVAIWAGAVVCSVALAIAAEKDSEKPSAAKPAPEKKPALAVNDPRAFQGYTLVAPLQSTKTYLIDMQGRVVRTWESRYTAGQDAYLLENGHLLRAANLGENEAFFAGASQGGRIQEFTWEGELIWDYKFHNEKQIRHHSITRTAKRQRADERLGAKDASGIHCRRLEAGDGRDK